MIRVLLVDDQALVRSGFRLILERAADLTIVGEAANGAEAVALGLELRPDEHVYDAIRAGASGFLLKDVLPNRPPARGAARARWRGDAGAVAHEAAARGVARPPARGRCVIRPVRELETARAVSRGLSNAEIGKELFLSEATVKTHVTRVLGKLGLRDRVQIVMPRTKPA